MGHKSLETTMRYLVPRPICMIVWMRSKSPESRSLRFPRKRRAVSAV
jgi:hypothetical protein